MDKLKQLFLHESNIFSDKSKKMHFR